MTTLRVWLEAAWERTRAAPWVLVSPPGDALATGSSPASGWPEHDHLELVIAASQTRIIPVRLPPVPSARTAAAVRFAIEDQIAGGEAGAHVAVSRQRGDGVLLAILVPLEIMASLDHRSGALAKLSRVIAEPELAAPHSNPTWRWCGETDAQSGFVRMPDGTAFPVGMPDTQGRLPPELRFALTQGAASPGKPVVRVEWPAPAQALAQWQQETEVPFVAGPPWRWEAVDSAPATNLLQGAFALSQPSSRFGASRIIAPAAILLGLAAAFHVLATAGHWLVLKSDAWRASSQWTALALSAGLANDTSDSPDKVRAALARRHAEVLHMHRMPAPDDALPLMARASSAIARLPRGAVKRAVYADAHWTLEVAAADAASLGDLQAQLRQARVDAIVVAVPGGARVRLGSP
ncbi:MAG: type II secretion system protein GspL [Betaproteobacteria bacterium]